MLAEVRTRLVVGATVGGLGIVLRQRVSTATGLGATKATGHGRTKRVTATTRTDGRDSRSRSFTCRDIGRIGEIDKQ
jgi:hypothetical protein